MSNLVDFHVHIDYYKDYLKIYDWYNTNKVYALFVTNLPEIYERCIKIFKSSKYVKFALGYNPQLIAREKFNKQVFNKYLNTTKYVGEVGLDFSGEFIAHKSLQIEVFDYICNKSSKNNKILSIHSRNAEKEVLDILRVNKVKFAVFHWYTGELKVIDDIVNEGYYFSVNSSMLRSNKGRKVITKIPIDRILIETDGPFSKFNNKLVKPADLIEIYTYFEDTLNINGFDKIVSGNLKNLLMSQSRLNNIPEEG